jgi:mycothione reductase
MKEYDFIAIGSGSAMSIIDALLQHDSDLNIAVIDKDDPGGICLTRGCIPSKLLLYPAEVVKIIENASKFGINVDIRKIDFSAVMGRMRSLIQKDVDMIRNGLKQSPNIDYYPTQAEFVAPYTLKVGDETITSKTIFLCTGSKPKIPPIDGIEYVNYYTSDSILKIAVLPKSIVIVGGGYIAAEYGFFFSAMGSKVTIIGRNPQFIPNVEPEISSISEKELKKDLEIFTNYEVKVVREKAGKNVVVAVNRQNGKEVEILADEILIASGRASNTDILHPEKGGIDVDENGWILVDEYLETSKPNVWAFGDANGHHLFKHVANYESQIVYYNAILKKKVKVDYHAIPYAIFSHPEIASVGLGEREAIRKFGEDNVLIGFHRYEDTAKGEAMAVKSFFVKIIVEKNTMRILGAHIVGPHASILIQEVIDLMYTKEQTVYPIIRGMHIHPALSEVVQRAFNSFSPLEHYHHLISHYYKLLD